MHMLVQPTVDKTKSLKSLGGKMSTEELRQLGSRLLFANKYRLESIVRNSKKRTIDVEFYV